MKNKLAKAMHRTADVCKFMHCRMKYFFTFGPKTVRRAWEWKQAHHKTLKAAY